MYKKFNIWGEDISEDTREDMLADARDIDPERWESAEEGGYLEQEEYEYVTELLRDYLDDERSNLNIQLNNPIIVIADLGLWDGRVPAYKFIDSGNISDILCATQNDSECRWYCDGYNIVCDEVHHDGTNHYIYREVRDMDTIHNIVDRIMCREHIPTQMLNRYTRSIAGDVAEVYGLVKKTA